VTILGLWWLLIYLMLIYQLLSFCSVDDRSFVNDVL
jgi:hypothetical protein